MNYAKQAMNNHEEIRRQARGINLDHLGQPVNPVNHWGNPWKPSAIRSAQESRLVDVYSQMLSDLIDLTDYEDTYIVNTYNKYLNKARQAVAENPHMLDTLSIAYLNNRKNGVALIAYAAVSTILTPTQFVDFFWARPAQEHHRISYHH